MPRTTYVERLANRIIVSKHSEYLRPHWDVGVRLSIPNEKHSMLSSAQKDVDPVGSL